MKETLIKLTRTVFSYGMAILMIVALLVAVCYLAAFIVGCPASEAICGFLNTYILPCVYVSGIVLCGLGVLNMYLSKTHVFMLDISSKKTQT